MGEALLTVSTLFRLLLNINLKKRLFAACTTRNIEVGNIQILLKSSDAWFALFLSAHIFVLLAFYQWQSERKGQLLNENQLPFNSPLGVSVIAPCDW